MNQIAIADTNQVVKKSTSIVNLRGRLSAVELNLVTILIKAVKDAEVKHLYDVASDKTNVDLTTSVEPSMLPDDYQFHRSELGAILQQSDRAVSAIFSQVNKDGAAPIDSLMSKVITFEVGDGWVKEQLLGPSSYKSGVLTMRVLPNVKRAILDETKGYSAVDMKLYMKIKGSYDKRLLDFISQFKNDRSYQASISELEARFDILVSDFSDGFKGFRVSVLQRPMERILKISDGVWEATDEAGKGYEVIKRGRHAVAVKFHVKYNEDRGLEILQNQQEAKERKKLAAEAGVTIKDRDRKMKIRMLQALEYDLLAVVTPTKDDLADMLNYAQLAKELEYNIPSNVSMRIRLIEKAFS